MHQPPRNHIPLSLRPFAPLSLHLLAPLCLGAFVPLCLATASGSEPAKAPYKILYSNDSTNIASCISPYHRARQPVTDDMLRATIDEAAAADCQLLQPGLGWVPFWQSKLYPPAEHYRYYQDKGDFRPSSFAKYLLAGGDMVETFVEHCHQKKLAAFVSLRLNDGHHLDLAVTGDPRAADSVSRFYREHFLEYRLGPDPKDWSQRVLNWAIPAVREHKLAFIRELCQNYDLDGFELDYMRFFNFFRQKETTGQQRREIMTGFVRQVREVLDRTARPGRQRWLCVRVPALLETHDALGIDLPAMRSAGVEMFNLSCSYFTVQQLDLAAFRKLLPDAAIYLEMTHTTLTGPSRGGYDSFTFERTKPEQFYTTAHLAYRHGLDGLSLFNFVYYREHGTEGRGPFNEPPFEVLGRLADRDFVARQPQWYVVAGTGTKPLFTKWLLPRILKAEEKADFRLDLRPNEQRTRDGLVRVLAAAALPDKSLQVTINGEALEPADFVRKPLPHPYEAMLGDAEQFACLKLPRRLVRDGYNDLQINNTSPKTVKLLNIDLVLP